MVHLNSENTFFTRKYFDQIQNLLKPKNQESRLMSKDTTDHQSNWKSVLNWLNEEHFIDLNQIKVELIIDPKNNQRTLIANQDINEGTPIISIPNQALLNISTLPSFFINQLKPYKLNSFQIISYYLSKHHPNRQTIPKKYLFQEYIKTLPNSFNEIPLCLILEGLFGDLNQIKIQDYSLNSINQTNLLFNQSFEIINEKFKILKWMTNSIKLKCDEVTKRFLIDWKSVSKIKIEEEEEVITLDQFLWGWLNVNTRCLWFDLGIKNHDDNITLAPLIDMVNHTLSSKIKPISTPNTFSLYSSYPNNQFNSPKSKKMILSSKQNFDSYQTNDQTFLIQKGDEILFSYGSHSNLTLWSEYGFILKSTNIQTNLNDWNSIDITNEILNLFNDELKDNELIEKLSILKESNYWKDYTIESNPIGPSYRTLTSLRLLYCPYKSLSNWYQIINGEKDELNLNIEIQIKFNIQKICLKLINEIQSNLINGSNYFKKEIGECIKDLMLEEKLILERCVEVMKDSNWKH